MLARRSFFKALAGVAALPLVSKLPLPAQRVAERVGAWATVRVEAGQITSISIISAGSGYTSAPEKIISSVRGSFPKNSDMRIAIDKALEKLP